MVTTKPIIFRNDSSVGIYFGQRDQVEIRRYRPGYEKSAGYLRYLEFLKMREKWDKQMVDRMMELFRLTGMTMTERFKYIYDKKWEEITKKPGTQWYIRFQQMKGLLTLMRRLKSGTLKYDEFYNSPQFKAIKPDGEVSDLHYWTLLRVIEQQDQLIPVKVGEDIVYKTPEELGIPLISKDYADEVLGIPIYRDKKAEHEKLLEELEATSTAVRDSLWNAMLNTRVVLSSGVGMHRKPNGVWEAHFMLIVPTYMSPTSSMLGSMISGSAKSALDVGWSMPSML